jgi:uncharacterized protein (TIGR00369 family)
MTTATTTAADVQAWLGTSPFVTFLGICCTHCDSDAGVVSFELPLRPELERDSESNRFHGGPIAALVDIAADLGIMAVVGHPVPTIDFRVDYLRPSLGPMLGATATVRRIGRTVATADVDVSDATGKLTAIGRGTFATVRPDPDHSSDTKDRS